MGGWPGQHKAAWPTLQHYTQPVRTAQAYTSGCGSSSNTQVQHMAGTVAASRNSGEQPWCSLAHCLDDEAQALGGAAAAQQPLVGRVLHEVLQHGHDGACGGGGGQQGVRGWGGRVKLSGPAASIRKAWKHCQLQDSLLLLSLHMSKS